MSITTQAMRDQVVKPVVPNVKNLIKNLSIVELVFYLYLLYSNFAVKLGIYFQLGAPLILAVLVLLILPKTLFSKSARLGPAFLLALCTAGWFLVNQFISFNLPYTHQYVSVMVVWPMLVFVMDFLLLKPFSFHRISIMIFVIGLMVLPFLLFQETHTYSRARIEKGVSGFDNPNDLAAWFGFAGLYFWVSALQESGWKTAVRQVISILLFFVMSMTLSRGTAIATLAALLVSFRSNKLNRQWIVLALVVGITIYAGSRIELVGKVKSGYEARLNEESGRITIWPLVVKTIRHYPFTGMGVTNIKTFSSEKKSDITPHNAFLFLGLSSGMIVMIPFTILWILALYRSFKRSAPIHRQSLDPFPFVVFTFVIINFGNLQFASVWATMSLCYALAPLKSIPQKKRKICNRGINRLYYNEIPVRN